MTLPGLGALKSAKPLGWCQIPMRTSGSNPRNTWIFSKLKCPGWTHKGMNLCYRRWLQSSNCLCVLQEGQACCPSPRVLQSCQRSVCKDSIDICAWDCQNLGPGYGWNQYKASHWRDPGFSRHTYKWLRPEECKLSILLCCGIHNNGSICSLAYVRTRTRICAWT